MNKKRNKMITADMVEECKRLMILRMEIDRLLPPKVRMSTEPGAEIILAELLCERKETDEQA